MVDSGDEHESIVGWVFQPNNETDVDAKMPRGKDAKSVTENTKSILTPMAGEEAVVHERLASVTNAGVGED